MQMRSLVCGCISEWFESGLRVTLHVQKTNVWWRNSYGGSTGEGINFFPIRFTLPQRKKIPPPQLSSTCGDATISRLLPLGIFASYKLIFVHFIFVLFCWFFFFCRIKPQNIVCHSTSPVPQDRGMRKNCSIYSLSAHCLEQWRKIENQM